jgi:hypothetical protein
MPIYKEIADLCGISKNFDIPFSSSYIRHNNNILKYLAVKQQLEKKKPGTGNVLETSEVL